MFEKEMEYREIWMNFTLEQRMAVFAFIDSDESGVSKYWILNLFKYTNVPAETLDSLIIGRIVDVLELKEKRIVFKLRDSDFYKWVTDTFTKQ